MENKKNRGLERSHSPSDEAWFPLNADPINRYLGAPYIGGRGSLYWCTKIDEECYWLRPCSRSNELCKTYVLKPRFWKEKDIQLTRWYYENLHLFEQLFLIRFLNVWGRFFLKSRFFSKPRFWTREHGQRALVILLIVIVSKLRAFVIGLLAVISIPIATT